MSLSFFEQYVSKLACSLLTDYIQHTVYLFSLDSRPRRERRPGIPCMRIREIIKKFHTNCKKMDKVTNTYDHVVSGKMFMTTMAAFRDTN